MAVQQTSRDVSAKEALDCIKSGMSNAEIMSRFKITPSGYADLLKQLFLKKLISQEDMARRGIRFKVVKTAPAEVEEITPAEKPALPKVPLLAPEPEEGDEEFLDTVTLTELLSFKSIGGPASAKDAEPKEIAPPAPEQQEASDKKGKFNISGLFKKK